MNSFDPPNPYAAATRIGARFNHPPLRRGGGGGGNRGRGFRGGNRSGAPPYYQNRAGPSMNGSLSPQQQLPTHPITQTLQQLRASSWDFPLECPNARTAEIGDKDFLAKLTFGNVFGVCMHDVKPISCPCGGSKAFCCSKCKSFFCTDTCSRLLTTEQKQALDELHASMGLPPPGGNAIQGPSLGVPRFRVASDSNAGAAAAVQEAQAQAGEKPSHSQSQSIPPTASGQSQTQESEAANSADLVSTLSTATATSSESQSPSPSEVIATQVEAKCDPALAWVPEVPVQTPQAAVSTFGVAGRGVGRGRGRGKSEGSESGGSSVVGLPPPPPPVLCAERLTIGETVEVQVTWTLDPAEIYIAPISIREKHGQIEALINSVQVHDWEPLPPDPRVDTPCIAYFDDGDGDEEGRGLYRAKVVEANANPLCDTDSCTVKFVDYGNIAQVSKSELKAIPTALRQIPALATRVIFRQICPPQSEVDWSEEAVRHFKGLVGGKVCRFTPTDAGESPEGFYFGGVLTVRVGDGRGEEEDVCERMIRDGYAEEFQMDVRF